LRRSSQRKLSAWGWGCRAALKTGKVGKVPTGPDLGIRYRSDCRTVALLRC